MKKILSALVAIVIAFGSMATFEAMASDTGISIDEPEISVSNMRFVFYVYLDGYRRSGYEADIFFATYDSKGNLLNVEKGTPDTYGEATASLPITRKEKYYKIMVFDANDELKPLCKAFKANLSYTDYTKVSVYVRDLEKIDTTNKYVDYYVNLEESSKTARIKLSSNYTCKVNGVSSNLTDVIKFDDGLIKFYDRNLDGKFESVAANTYRYGFVGAVDLSGNSISIDGKEVDLSSGTVELISSMEVKLFLSRFKVGDFVAVSSDSEEFYEYESYLQIVRLDENIFNGMVEETYTDTYSNYVVINGVKYINSSGAELQPGDEGVFYIDLTGRVIRFE